MKDMVLNFLIRLKTDERGLTAVEYAVLGGIVVAAISAVGEDFTKNLSNAFANLF
ncbi:Flp family type IVb pilin [Novosphingobium sp. BL-8A]|uniref:Flp family type IVb pilin n=1 Tax=Novosphingobium sp. BL-8A TaxID=3127639 RepID=UPI0037565AE6